jgi:hypothetical protein
MFARPCMDYSELIGALRDRAAALELSRLAIDERAGFHTGYTGKLLAATPARIFGPVSLGPTLETLGLCILLVEDTLAASRTLEWRTPVDTSNQRMGNKNGRAKRSLAVEPVEPIEITKIAAAPERPASPVSRAHLRVIQQSKGGRKYG